MKFVNKIKFNLEMKSAGRIKCVWIWIAMALIVVAAAGCVTKPDDLTKNETLTMPATTNTPVTTDVIPPSSPDETQNVITELPSAIKLQSLGAYSSSNGTISIPKILYILSYPPDAKGYYIVQFRDTTPEEYKARVTNLSGEFFGYIPDDAHLVKMNDSTKNKVQKLEIVQWVGIYQPAYKIRPGLLNKKGNVTLDILIFGGENITSISHELESIGGMISEFSEVKIRVRINASTIAKIANINGVMWIEEHMLPTIQSGIK